ncbi:MAG: TM2 domain-containing protein [Bacteroidota bacterium]
MKKLLLLTMMMAFMASVSTFASSKYKIDDVAVEQVLDNGVAVVTADAAANTVLDVNSTNAQLAEKNALVAIILDFFLGGLGVHRVYLGGSGILILGYIVTCFGIFGLIPLVDLIVLAINFDDISKYVDNDALFMW